MKKVFLGIPSYKSVSSIAFKHQMEFSAKLIADGIVNRLYVEPDVYIAVARNKISKIAIKLWEDGVITHVLFLDDDVFIPDGGVAAMLNDNLPVVSGLCFTRDLKPMAYNLTPTYRNIMNVPDRGLLTVDVACTGCLLLDCSVLKEMQTKYNDDCWFQSEFRTTDKGEKVFVGEDVFFFERLKEMGIPAVVDCRIHCDHSSVGVATLEAYRLVNSNIRAAEATGMVDKRTKGIIGI